jgi:hypothetical protein
MDILFRELLKKYQTHALKSLLFKNIFENDCYLFCFLLD